MTPDEVRRHRQAHRFGGGDLYAATGLGQFVDRSVIAAQLDAESQEIGRILQHVPDFASLCDYHWAADPASYDVPSEAAFQRRAILMMAKYWVETPEPTELADKLAGVIVVQEFITQFGLSSARLLPAGQGRRVLSVPASFNELALWLFVGLRCWTALETGQGRDHGDDGGWSMVTTPITPRAPRPFDHVSTYELIARTLADRGRDRALYGVNAALLIREQVPELAGEGGEVDVDHLPFFDQNATYMVSEFALAHELGHLLAGHVPGSSATATDLEHEAEADRFAGLLIAISSATRVFGWGTEIHTPWVQAAIGLALFDCFLTGRTALANGLLRRSGIAEAGKELLESERVRAAVARLQLKGLLVTVARAENADDARRIATLVDNCNGFLRDVRMSMAALPDAQVRRALEIARGSVALRA